VTCNNVSASVGRLFQGTGGGDGGSLQYFVARATVVAVLPPEHQFEGAGFGRGLDDQIDSVRAIKGMIALPHHDGQAIERCRMVCDPAGEGSPIHCAGEK
jgi:hypothetical protein